MLSLIFYVKILLQTLIGVTLVAIGIDFHHHAIYYLGKDIRIKIWLIVMYAVLAMTITTFLVTKILASEKMEYLLENYLLKPVTPVMSKKDIGIKIILIFLSILSLLSVSYVYFVMYFKIGTIPILELIKGASYEKLIMIRISTSYQFASDYIYRLGGTALTPLLAYIYYVYCLKLAPSFKYRVLFIFYTLLSILILGCDLKKGWVLNFFIGILLIKIMLNGGIKFVKLAFFVLITLASLLWIYSASQGLGNIVLAFRECFLPRLLIGQIAPLYHYFLIFPDRIPFLHGASFPTWMHRFFGTGLEHISTPLLIKSIWNPELFFAGKSHYGNTFFVGDAYANFGWIGVFLSPIIVGLELGIVYTTFLCLPKNPINIAIFGFLSIRLSDKIVGSFTNIVWDASLVVLFFSYCMGYIILKTSHKNRCVSQRA